MTVKELAEYLSFGKTNIYLLVSKKQIPVCHIGKNIRFIKSEIDKWLLRKSSKGKK